jgi:hypothetical protein
MAEMNHGNFVASACLTAVLFVSPRPTEAQENRLDAFLRNYAGFSEVDIQAMDAGSVIVKSLETDAKSEVMLVGVSLIEAPTEFFLRMYRDIERFEGGLGDIKKLSDPPLREDFAAMPLPEEDLRDLRDCRPGRCKVKIGDRGLDKLREVDWDAADASQQALDVVRERAYSLSHAYREGGNAALGVVRDAKKPTFIAKEFEELLANSPYVLEYEPELHRYLLDYPQAKLDDATDFMYWALNDLGRKPILRLSHVVIYPAEDGANASTVIASKQLYFSHYFHTGLDLRFLVRNRKRPESDSFYFVTLSRARSNDLTGIFGSVVRATAQAGARDGLKRYLEICKEAIDRYYRERER